MLTWPNTVSSRWRLDLSVGPAKAADATPRGNQQSGMPLRRDHQSHLGKVEKLYAAAFRRLARRAFMSPPKSGRMKSETKNCPATAGQHRWKIVSTSFRQDSDGPAGIAALPC